MPSCEYCVNSEGTALCNRRSAQEFNGFYCTRVEGHEGDHVACSESTHVLVRWGDIQVEKSWWDQAPKAIGRDFMCYHCKRESELVAIAHHIEYPGEHPHVMFCRVCQGKLNRPAWGACNCAELEGVER